MKKTITLTILLLILLSTIIAPATQNQKNNNIQKKDTLWKPSTIFVWIKGTMTTNDIEYEPGLFIQKDVRIFGYVGLERDGSYVGEPVKISRLLFRLIKQYDPGQPIHITIDKLFGTIDPVENNVYIFSGIARGLEIIS